MPISPRTLRPSSTFTPRSISGLALWLDASSSDLYTTDAGPVVAVNQPTAIAGCVGWWDASEASTLFADNSGSTLATTTVARWANKVAGGSDKDLLQTDSTKRPTITANYIGGMQSIVFDGVNDALTRAFTLDATCHLFCVLKWPSSFASNLRAFDGFNGNTLSLTRLSNTTFNAIGSASNVLATANFNSLIGQIVEIRKDGAASRVVANGTGQLTGDLGATSPGGLTLGAFGLGTAAFDNVGIAEVIAFSDPLSVADAARVSAYLAAKWSISGVHAPATASSDPVGYWGDRSGNGRHAVQAQSARRPGYLTTDANGKPSVSFSGSFPSVITNEFTFANAATVFAVAKNTNNSFGGMFQRGTVNERHSGFRNAGTITARRGSGNDATVPFTSSDYSVFQWSFGASLSLPGVNGVAGTPNTTSNSFASTAMPLRVGSLGDGSLGMIGGLSEFLYYEATLTDLQAAAVRRYLARKYGVTLTVIPTVANADAQDWVNRVYQNGGSVSSATAASVNQLCDSLDAASLRDRFYRLNLFCGTGLNAALVPLYRGPSLGGTQYGGATDTNVGGLFVSGNYSETTGLTAPLSSTNYLDTGFTTVGVPASVYESMHMSGWHGPIGAINTDPMLLGVFSTERQALQTSIRTASPGFETGRMGKTTTVLATNGVQGARPSTFLLTQRTSAISLQLYRNGVLENTTATSVTGIGTVAIPVFVFRNNNGGTPQGDMPGFAMRQYSIGDDMTEPQVLAFYNAMAAFNTAMGRTA